jgi:hypothetical protein
MAPLAPDLRSWQVEVTAVAPPRHLPRVAISIPVGVRPCEASPRPAGGFRLHVGHDAPAQHSVDRASDFGLPGRMPCPSRGDWACETSRIRCCTQRRRDGNRDADALAPEELGTASGFDHATNAFFRDDALDRATVRVARCTAYESIGGSRAMPRLWPSSAHPRG